MDVLRAADPVGLGPYQLLGRLGSGGLGDVFLGRRDTGDLAAVKAVHAGYAVDPRFLATLAREIEIVRAIRAPWAAAVVDADLDGPVPWLASEYVAGPTLEEAVTATGPLDATAVGSLAVRLTDALVGLHGLGIVHQGLTPSNVVLAADGPRLIDVGVGRSTGAATVTVVGTTLPPADFLSPEQALGDEAGPSSDVFSLASVLVFACTGTGPFGLGGPPLATARRIADGHADLSGVPHRLGRELQHCLVKHPAARPTAARLRTRLEQWAGPELGDAWRPDPGGAWIRDF